MLHQSRNGKEGMKERKMKTWKAGNSGFNTVGEGNPKMMVKENLQRTSLQ